jgi:hypothetical protein
MGTDTGFISMLDKAQCFQWVTTESTSAKHLHCRRKNYRGISQRGARTVGYSSGRAIRRAIVIIRLGLDGICHLPINEIQ